MDLTTLPISGSYGAHYLPNSNEYQAIGAGVYCSTAIFPKCAALICSTPEFSFHKLANHDSVIPVAQHRFEIKDHSAVVIYEKINRRGEISYIQVRKHCRHDYFDEACFEDLTEWVRCRIQGAQVIDIPKNWNKKEATKA